MNKIIPAAGAADADSEAKPPTTSSDAVAAFDYAGEAELFPTRRWRSTRSSYGYRRFARAADAIRFAIEELPPELLLGSVLEVAEERFDGDAIRRLYDSPDYPHARGVRRAAERKRGAGAATSKEVGDKRKRVSGAAKPKIPAAAPLP